ncbi:MAG: GntR family transcriptional regulator [Firmicutes bacterium]|nr:GntR family transcriptional regulator [Bacillota bacterium]
MAEFKPPQNNLLHIEVINAIINAIVSGELKPGDHIVEQHIAQQMQISRAPVREAIRELAAQDIIRLIPRKGAFVAPLDPKNIEGIYLLRSYLEGLAARLAVLRLTEADLNELYLLNYQMGEAALKNNVNTFIDLDLRFHDFICQHCAHPQLKKMIDGVQLQTKLFMNMSKWHLAAHSELHREMNAHQPLLEALRARNQDEAEMRMREHIIMAGNLLLEYLVNKKSITNREQNGDHVGV